MSANKKRMENNKTIKAKVVLTFDSCCRIIYYSLVDNVLLQHMWNEFARLNCQSNVAPREDRVVNFVYCVIDRVTIRSGDTVYRHRANIVKTSIYSRLSRPVEQQTSTYTKTVMAVLYHKAPILYESWSLQPSTFPLFLIKRVVSCYNKRPFDFFSSLLWYRKFSSWKTNHGTKWSKSYLVVYTGTRQHSRHGLLSDADGGGGGCRLLHGGKE